MGPAVCFSIAARISGMVVLTGAAVASSGCSAGRADTSRDAAETPRPVTMTVSRGSIAPRFLLTGELEAVAAANLAVPANPNGQTTIRWMADEGAIVKAGDKVVEFDTASFASDYGEKVLLRDQARRLVGKRLVLEGDRLVTAYHAVRSKQRLLLRGAEARSSME